MRIMKIDTRNLRPLEDELDRIGFEKYGYEPHLRTTPSTDIFDDEIGYDFEGDEEDV